MMSPADSTIGVSTDPSRIGSHLPTTASPTFLSKYPKNSSNRIESSAITSVVNIAPCSGFQRASRLAPVQVAQYSPQLLTCGRQLVNDMMTQLRESSLSLNGALLVLAGFLGFFSALQLDLQRCILSVYVLFFGLLMCAISIGWKREVFERYFGFAYTPKGQLVFVLVAGNLAWLCGWVGWLVAAYTNVNAYQAWERAAANAVPFEYGNRWNNYAQAAI